MHFNLFWNTGFLYFFIFFKFIKIMKTKELYENYLSKLEEALIKDEKENIDFIIESLYTMGLPEKELDEIDDILHEATLYLELWDQEYKETAIDLISDFKN